MLPLPRHVLGRTGIEVSRLGLAGMSVRTKGPGGKLTATDVERAFYELGATTFLVHPFMPEICEGVRRLIRAGHRDELVLISEVSMPFAGSVRRGLEKLARSLETDRIDVWLFGWVQHPWQVRPAVWNAMQALKSEGKTRAIGFSTHDRRIAATLGASLPTDVLMVRYNAAHRGAEREIFAKLDSSTDARPGVIAYTATRWGMLLRPLPEHGAPQPMTGAECYRFVLEHPQVDMAWCAARTWDELAEDVAGVLAGPLDPTRREEVVRFGDAVHAAAKYGEKWMFGTSAES